MKKLIISCMALIAMCACSKNVELQPLAEEDAAALPYQSGQTVRFLNQENDTIVFQVIGDWTHPSDGYDYYHNYGADSIYYGMPRDYCYARTVDLACETFPFFISFTILPEKELYFNWHHELVICCELLPSDETFSINGTTYEHMTHDRLYNQYTGEMLYDWYYNQEFGLLYFEKGEVSLTRIP